MLSPIQILLIAGLVALHAGKLGDFSGGNEKKEDSRGSSSKKSDDSDYSSSDDETSFSTEGWSKLFEFLFNSQCEATAVKEDAKNGKSLPFRPFYGFSYDRLIEEDSVQGYSSQLKIATGPFFVQATITGYEEHFGRYKYRLGMADVQFGWEKRLGHHQGGVFAGPWSLHGKSDLEGWQGGARYEYHLNPYLFAGIEGGIHSLGGLPGEHRRVESYFGLEFHAVRIEFGYLLRKSNTGVDLGNPRLGFSVLLTP